MTTAPEVLPLSELWLHRNKILRRRNDIREITDVFVQIPMIERRNHLAPDKLIQFPEVDHTARRAYEERAAKIEPGQEEAAEERPTSQRDVA